MILVHSNNPFDQSIGSSKVTSSFVGDSKKVMKVMVAPCRSQRKMRVFAIGFVSPLLQLLPAHCHPLFTSIAELTIAVELVTGADVVVGIAVELLLLLLLLLMLLLELLLLAVLLLLMLLSLLPSLAEVAFVVATESRLLRAELPPFTNDVPSPYKWPQYLTSSMLSSKNISLILKKAAPVSSESLPA